MTDEGDRCRSGGLTLSRSADCRLVSRALLLQHSHMMSTYILDFWAPSHPIRMSRLDTTSLTLCNPYFT